MTKATWNGRTLAESHATILVEGNHYFPPDAVDRSLLEKSETHSFCGWKGSASYFHVVVEGERNEDAAWCYPEPMDAATQIRDYVAFWHGVDVVDEA